MVYVQHVFKAHPEQVFLRYFWLFLWLHSGLEICKVIRLILPKTCKFNTHNSPIFPYKPMCYDLFRSDYITFLTRALPLRSAKTFIELLMCSLLTQSGFVTSAIWILDMARQWPGYYKWLETGQRSYLKLMRQWTALFLKLFGDNPVYLAIDDSIVLRHSKKAPMSQIHHQHGNKTNLSRHVRGQCRVALAAIVKRSGCNTALPLLLRLTPQAGNSGKLVIARSLIRALM